MIFIHPVEIDNDYSKMRKFIKNIRALSYHYLSHSPLTCKAKAFGRKNTSEETR